MAAGVRWVCDHCSRSVEAWSDGNPYYIDVRGRKRYAYHPDHENLARCIGNDVPHLCLACGSEVIVDSRSPREDCPGCGARRLVAACDLDGQPCPYCEDGTFRQDPDFLAIS